MLRFFLLDGRWPAVPWEVLVTLGGALWGASIMFVLLYPDWSSLPVLGAAEVAIMATLGGGLLLGGSLRRSHRPRSGTRRVGP